MTLRLAIVGETAAAERRAARYAAATPHLAVACLSPDAVSRLPAPGGGPPFDLAQILAGSGPALPLARRLAGQARALLLPWDAAGTAADAARLLRAVRRQHQRLFLDATLPFHPACARVLELVASGCLGPLSDVTLCREGDASAPDPSRPPTAVLGPAGLLPAAALLAQLAPATVGVMPTPCTAEPGETWRVQWAGAPCRAVLACAPTAGTPPAWRIEIAGRAARLAARFADRTTDAGAAARAPVADRVTVQRPDGGRTYPVPEADPAALCVAAALLCLRTGQDLPCLSAAGLPALLAPCAPPAASA